jgi:heme A synthase
MQALGAIFCHVVFDAGLHGLFMAFILGAIGYVCHARGAKQGKPLLKVCKKLTIFCLAIMIPGFISLITTHKLPPVGVYNIHSIGFICFWGWICLHISAEEMNHQFFKGGADSEPDLQGN